MRQMKGGVSAHAQDEALIHFGVNNRSLIDLVKVFWPSGTVQKLNNVVANQRITFTEAEPYVEAGGMAVFEAEHEDTNGLFDDQSWDETTAFADYSGDAAMQAGPDIGTRITNPNRGGPAMTYGVDFTTTGTYYIWVRAWAPDTQARRVHVGLNGRFSRDEGRYVTINTVGSWVWTNFVPTGRAVLEVSQAGQHSVNVSMAQDGMVVDKVVLTTDPGFVPTGHGPATSPRSLVAPIASATTLPSASEAHVETVPAAYGLEPSYPNPFTGVTTIPFATPSNGAVRLEVYDLLGRRVATLVDEVVTAGSHEVNWNASDLPSGMYFVRLTAGSFMATERMSLVR